MLLNTLRGPWKGQQRISRPKWRDTEVEKSSSRERPGPQGRVGLELGKVGAEGAPFKDALNLRIRQMSTLHMHKPESECFLK